MSDNLKRYRAICDALKQFFLSQRSPHQWQHFRVMAAMINGIVGSHHVHLPKMADPVDLHALRGRWATIYLRALHLHDAADNFI